MSRWVWPLMCRRVLSCSLMRCLILPTGSVGATRASISLLVSTMTLILNHHGKFTSWLVANSISLSTLAIFSAPGNPGLVIGKDKTKSQSTMFFVKGHLYLYLILKRQNFSPPIFSSISPNYPNSGEFPCVSYVTRTHDTYSYELEQLVSN